MRVLIIEDNPADAALVRAYLEEARPPVQVLQASRLSEGLEYLGRGDVDVLLLDMSLPDSVGIESLRRARDVFPNQPIVILSGLQDEALATAAVQAGAQDYLVKGHVDGLTLARALRYALERQQLVEQLAASEARLQEENALLRQLSESAARIFSTLDPRAVVSLVCAEAQRLWRGMATLYTLRLGTEPVWVEGAEPVEIDAFIRDAFTSSSVRINESRRRLTMPIAGSEGRIRWVLEVSPRADRMFEQRDIFAFELLRHKVGIAIRNLALLGEVESQRASVIELNELKNDLIALLAHDFKGPLTSIVGFAEMLEDRGMQEPRDQQALRSIRAAAYRLAELANDTLMLSRLEQGELQMAEDPVDVGELVADVCASLRAQRRIDLNDAGKNVLVRGDPGRLRQVLENVIGNAIKYSPSGEPVMVRVWNDGEFVRVAVTDRGIGVPAGEIALLFNRFARASNAKASPIKGTGLGLYLAKTIAERHGGRIEVESEIGTGSTFTIALPHFLDKRRTIMAILVITQDRLTASLLEHELRRNSYRTRWAESIEDARARLEVDHCDAVIVDRDTATGDVHALMSWARAQEPQVPLIAIGESAHDKSLAWDGTLPRRFLLVDLLATLERVESLVG